MSGKEKRMIEKLNQILQGLLKNPIVDEYDTSVGGNVVFSVLRGAALVTSWDMPVDVKIEGTWK